MPRHDHFSFFNGNDYNFPFSPFKTFAAAGSVSTLVAHDTDPFKNLKDFKESRKDWLIGCLGYDLKNSIEPLKSRNIDPVPSPDLYFFIPETLLFFEKDQVKIESITDPIQILTEIADTTPERIHQHVNLQADTSKQDYIQKVQQIKKQILGGDFYEMNYCIQFYIHDVSIDPASCYFDLNTISPMPFSVFQRLGEQYIICASPERYLKKAGSQLIAQPIKGTIRRDARLTEDRKLKSTLQYSEKERAENMMIVDLMRNDLGRSAVPGTVHVPEIFKVYTFNQLHQMISTVTCEINEKTDLTHAIKFSFPMGSMTGAPKFKVMEEIDRYEVSRRGRFSGASGYITPDGDFDFNVLIRSLFYDQSGKKLKFGVGSAITYDSDEVKEYDECMLKATAIKQVLGDS